MDLKIPNITPIGDIIEEKSKELANDKEIDSLIINQSARPKTKKGGKRPGAGRKKGRKDNATIIREKAEEAFKQKILGVLDSLFTGQVTLAQGCQYLFKIETKRWKTKNGKWKEKRKAPKVVKNPEEIEAYLRGDYDGSRDEYYFLTTDKPDNKAIDSLVERVFGKAKQSLDVNATVTLEDALRKNLEEREKYDKNFKRNNNID